MMLVEILQKQYTKCFSILKNVIKSYDESIWLNNIDYKTPTWQIVYHLVFYANIYCSSSENDIKQWPKSKDDYYDFEKIHELIIKKEIKLIPYTREDMMEYSMFVEKNIPNYLINLEPENKCWPYWYNESQLEFQINNLRHIQHHIGEIIERHDIKKYLSYIWE
jgi:hypothetical protein